MATITICDRCGFGEQEGREWCVLSVTVTPYNIPATEDYDLCTDCLHDMDRLLNEFEDDEYKKKFRLAGRYAREV